MGNTRGRRRRFGSVRALPSGQWQARYRGPDGIMRPADQTFATKIAAERWLIRTEADILAGDWIDPVDGLTPFGEYAAAWIEERPNLRPSTVEVYRYVFHRHLQPTLGNVAIGEIRETHVRRWRKRLIDSGAKAATVAKAYRLLKAIMATAVDDGLIRRNPCRIRGASLDKSPERPVLTVPQVFALADAISQRYRALILLAVFGSLRWGELAALRGTDIDMDARTVKVQRTLTELCWRRVHLRAAQIPCRKAHCGHSRPHPHRPDLAPGPLRRRCRRRPGVHQPDRQAAAPQQLPPSCVAARYQGSRPARHPLP
jgi:integrase